MCHCTETFVCDECLNDREVFEAELTESIWPIEPYDIADYDIADYDIADLLAEVDSDTLPDSYFHPDYDDTEIYSDDDIRAMMAGM